MPDDLNEHRNIAVKQIKQIKQIHHPFTVSADLS